MVNFFEYHYSTGNAPPRGNVRVINTVNYTYLAVLDPSTWYEARELCPLYGEGFFLTDIRSKAEWDEIKNGVTRSANNCW